MKKFWILFSILSGILLMGGIAFAGVITYSDINGTDMWISTLGTNPAAWFKLGFPDNTRLGGTYNPGLFEYDDYYNLNQVHSLTITLYGSDDNSSSPINMWLSFKKSHSDKFQIGSYNVPTNGNFSLIADIKNNAFFYNGGSGDVNLGTLLGGAGLEDFVDIDALWVGYACHFKHLQTEVFVSVGNNGRVPEPATMLLLGFGLLGLWGARKKFKK